MTYLSLEEQKSQQQGARLQISRLDTDMKSLGSYWYYPTDRLDSLHIALQQQASSPFFGLLRHRLFNRFNRNLLQDYLRQTQEDDIPLLDFGDDQYRMEETNVHSEELFCRCECCPDGDDPAVVSQNGYVLAEQPTLDQQWSELEAYADFRRGYLQRMDPQRTATRTEHGSTWDNEPVLHELCAACLAICMRSELINLFWGPTWHQLIRYFQNLSSPQPLTDESFPIYDAASRVRYSAFSGCHLCSMIWNSLNKPQQEELLARDQSRLAQDTAPDTAVYVKILSPHQHLWPEHSENTIAKDVL